MDGDSDDSDTEDFREKPTLMCRGRLLCLLALLLIAIGGGVAAYIILVDPFNGDSAPMTPPVSDQTSEMPTGSPTVSASEAPSETLQLSKEDCEAIRNGQGVDGQDEMEAFEYDVSIEIILDEEGNYSGTMATLVLRVREELLPSLVGCTESSRRSLGHTREDSQPLLQKSRQLEDTQYPIANAFVRGDYDNEATCRDDVVGDCRVGKLILEIFVKGEGQESAVEDIIDDVLGRNDPSQSLGERLELVNDSVLDIRLLTWNPTTGPNSAPSPIAVPSVNPSAFPSLRPSITLSDNPGLAPVIGPTTAGLTRSPSKPPSAALAPAPTSPPTQPPIPGLTPSLTSPPTVVPVVALTPVPTTPTTKQPTPIPTSVPSTPSSSPTTAVPSKLPTDAPSRSPSKVSSRTPTQNPTGIATAPAPTFLPSSDPTV